MAWFSESFRGETSDISPEAAEQIDLQVKTFLCQLRLCFQAKKPRLEVDGGLEKEPRSVFRVSPETIIVFNLPVERFDTF